MVYDGYIQGHLKEDEQSNISLTSVISIFMVLVQFFFIDMMCTTPKIANNEANLSFCRFFINKDLILKK